MRLDHALNQLPQNVWRDGIKFDRYLAEILGTTETSRQTLADLNDRVKLQQAALGPETATRVFVQISDEPLFTIGKESFLNEMIAIVGGVSVTNKVESPYPKLSKETASVLNPDVIILSESPDNQKPNEAFKNSPAMTKGRIYKINADLLSRPGPRLVDALEQIARVLNPERHEPQRREDTEKKDK